MPAASAAKRKSAPGQQKQERAAQGIAVVRLLGLQGAGHALVGIEQEGSLRPVRARMLTSLGREAVGREVAVMFEDGRPDRPVVMGVVGPWPSDEGAEAEPESSPEARDLEIDVERLLLSARDEIVLRCGKSSVTLTKCGKVLLRGAYVSTRSSGVNRIKGGSVQIN